MSEQISEAEWKKKASLWENSIVLAFRDMQWRHKGESYTVPEANLGLEGNIERALGDGIVSASEKLYLLEFKADAQRKSAEWTGEETKLSYQSLNKALDRAAKPETKLEAHPWVELSLRGHHFLYWSAAAHSADIRVRPGALMVSPYLLDMVLGPLQEHPVGDLIANQHSLGVRVRTGGAAQRIRGVFQILAGRLFSDEAVLVNQLFQQEATATSLGLTPAEMQEYVLWLVEHQSEKDLPINALLTSQNGAVCQHVSHITLLLELLNSLNSSPQVEQVALSSGLETGRHSVGEVFIAIPERKRTHDFGI